jgi:hypothetical protein
MESPCAINAAMGINTMSERYPTIKAPPPPARRGSENRDHHRCPGERNVNGAPLVGVVVGAGALGMSILVEQNHGENQ